MLKNLHVITGIIFALTIFCLLQVVTGGLFYSAVNNDRHNFQNSGLLNAQQESLSDSVNTLVKTRVTVTRVAIRYLKNQRDPASRGDQHAAGHRQRFAGQSRRLLQKLAGYSAGEGPECRAHRRDAESPEANARGDALVH